MVGFVGVEDGGKDVELYKELKNKAGASQFLMA
jgi:hypothetical protein